MGNHFDKYCDVYDDSNKICTSNLNVSRFLKSKFSNIKRKKQASSNEDFIINYSQANKRRDSILTESWDQRRVVFVSLLGAYQSWRNCPSFILFTAIFMMPLKREWIYHPVQYQREIRSTFISHLTFLSDVTEIREFIQLLQWKDSQGLVLWMMDDHKVSPDIPDYDELVHPFWYCLSEKLSALYDPITGKKYKPLRLKHNWLKFGKKFHHSLYDVKKVDVLQELFFLSKKFKAIMEIISVSNKSLNPIISYSLNNITADDIHVSTTSIYDDVEVDEINSNAKDWWISNDYDPYDISEELCS